MRRLTVVVFLLFSVALSGCFSKGVEKMPEKVVYLAGGCFWGMEKFMNAIPGVTDVVSGYANGETENPTYEQVATGLTGYRETVKVTYDPEEISLDAILLSYFYVIDPTVENRQGPDFGSEYQTGIYYTNDEDKEVIERIAELEARRYPRFVVEIEPLDVFYDAEEYHQNYLDKNPDGYCHIPTAQIELFYKMVVDPGDYKRPADEKIKEMLSPESYEITQNKATEEAFNNEFWNTFEKGIYVDIVTGEPLFSSDDKFDSSCGWPSFSKGIDPNVFFFMEDYSHDMERIEVKSRAGDSHLGHVFFEDTESPNGVRFCMNSASMKFIPYDKMEEEGYGYLMDKVKN